MTDARMPGRWLFELDGLSDRAFRVYVNSLMWSAEAGTDGELPPTSQRFFHPELVTIPIADELLAAGRWEQTEYGTYRVVDWTKSQSKAADVEKQREANRARQAAWRASHKGDQKTPTDAYPVTDDVTQHVTRDSKERSDSPTNDPPVTRDVTRESRRQGQDRQGQALKNHAGTYAHAREEEPPWPEYQHPDGEPAPEIPDEEWIA